MLVVNGDILRVVCNQELYGHCFTNALRWQVTDTKGNESPLAVQSAANDFHDYLGTSWQDNRSSQWAMVSVTLWNETTGNKLLSSNLHPIHGLVPNLPTLGSDPAPPYCVVNFRQQAVDSDTNKVVRNWSGMSGWPSRATTWGRVRVLSLWQFTIDSLGLPAVLAFSDWSVRPVVRHQTKIMDEPRYPVVTDVWVSCNVRTRVRRSLTRLLA